MQYTLDFHSFLKWCHKAILEYGKTGMDLENYAKLNNKRTLYVFINMRYLQQSNIEKENGGCARASSLEGRNEELLLIQCNRVSGLKTERLLETDDADD